MDDTTVIRQYFRGDKLLFSQTVQKLVPSMTGPPNPLTARGPVTLTAILFTQPAV